MSAAKQPETADKFIPQDQKLGEDNDYIDQENAMQQLGSALVDDIEERPSPLGAEDRTE